jgi:hypothetical protein
MAQSFNDIRQAVTTALQGVDKDKGADLIVSDLGPDWVVYQDPDTVGAGMFKRGYQIDSSGNVKFTSDPVKVAKQTSYEEADKEPTSLKEAGIKVREHFRQRRADARGQQATASSTKE